MASVVVSLLRRIVYLEDGLDGVSVGEAEDWTRLEKTIGTFWMVPLRDWSSLSMVTQVLGGRGSGEGSVRFWQRPQVSHLSYLMEVGKLIMGRSPSLSLNTGG